MHRRVGGAVVRVAIVTGAGQGLGRAFALRLAASGTAVVVNDKDAEAAEAVARECRGLGGLAVAEVSAVGSTASAAQLIGTTISAFGRIDAVIANAGIVRDRTIGNLSDTDIDDVLRVHLRGHIVLVREAWPHLKTHGHGRIVLITSAAALCGNIGQANYAAAKAGAIGLTHVLALEGARYGITANCLAPLAQTTMAGDVFGEAHASFRVDQVAPTAAHLSSEECEVTGLVLAVGGGLVTRIGLVETPGVELQDEHTAEDVRRVLANAIDLEGAVPIGALVTHLARHRLAPATS